MESPTVFEYDLLPGALALLRQAARIFENKLDNDPKISRTVDRKILSKIADKKLAQGLKLEFEAGQAVPFLII